MQNCPSDIEQDTCQNEMKIITMRELFEMLKIMQSLKKTKDEKGVEQILNKHLKITETIIRVVKSDGVADDKLFEYKFNQLFNTNGKWNKSAYKALAQSLFYLKNMSNFAFKGIEKLPSSIVICDKNGGFIVASKKFELIINDEALANINWNKQPSKPDENLVAYLQKNNFLQNIQYYEFDSNEKTHLFLETIINNRAVDYPQIQITENNFVTIFNLWKKHLLPNVDNSRELVDIFIADIEMLFTQLLGKNELINDDNKRINIPLNAYNSFWSCYKRPPSAEVRKYILANKDRLYDESTRTDFGDRYTPAKLAEVAFNYLAKKNPEAIASDNYVFWDCAAGGANLLINIQNKSNLILSTLCDEDIKTLKNSPYLKGALIEKHNFLKDKLPISIKEKLKKAKKVIFLINPPFNDNTGMSKIEISDPNHVDSSFYAFGLNPNDIRSVYSKFMYQIINIITEIGLTNVTIGIFSKTAWLNGDNYTDFRDYWFDRFKFNNGFIVPSTVFSDIKTPWPVMFSLWEYNTKIEQKNTAIETDVYDKKYNLIGKKIYQIQKNKKRLNKLIKMQKNRKLIDFVPLKNECEIYEKEPLYLNKMMENSYGCFRTISNDIQNSVGVIITSAPFGASRRQTYYITKDNFEDICFMYGVRKSVSQSWVNEKDEFLIDETLMQYLEQKQPYISNQSWVLEQLEKLRTKSILWTICEGGYTSSLYNINYKGNVYYVKNSFFALTDKEIQDLKYCKTSLLENDITIAAEWIANNKEFFTKSENELFASYKDLIVQTMNKGMRLSGEIKRQVTNPYASPRQLINGIYKYKGAHLTDEDTKVFEIYQENIKLIRKEIENLLYDLSILEKTVIKTKKIS